MLAPVLSSKQAKALALEVKAYVDRYHCYALHIESIDQYYTFFPPDVYNVHFTNGTTRLFIRNTSTGQLQTADALTYRAPDYTNFQGLYLEEVKQNLATFFADVARFVEQHVPGEEVSYTRNNGKEVIHLPYL